MSASDAARDLAAPDGEASQVADPSSGAPGDAPSPGGSAGGAGTGGGAGASAPPAPAAPKKARGGMRSLVLSMVVLLGFLLAWSAFTPKIAPKTLPAVDAASSARTVAAQSQWPIRFASTPPDGWRPTSVSYGPTKQGPTAWRVGYHNADDTRYVSVAQTRQAEGDQLHSWITDATFGGVDDGTLDAGGLSWRRSIAEGDPTRRALLAQDPSSKMTFVVSGPATYEDLQAFAQRLAPYRG